jgi:hypothetical protein
MPMFRPNKTGKLTRRLGRNIHGEATFRAPVDVACAIVTDLGNIKKTPVRSDSSASRGAGEETIAVAKILFPRNVEIGQDDTFAIEGLSLRVIGIQKRFAVSGALDHLEVDFDIAR